MAEESPLTEYLAAMSSTLEPATKSAIKSGIDEEAKKCFDIMKAGTPVRTGALASSLTMTKIDTAARYGWKIDYQGYDVHGQPFSEIARTLNKGGPANNYAATHHIDAAVHSLKGMDGRLAEKAEAAIEAAAEKK